MAVTIVTADEDSLVMEEHRAFEPATSNVLMDIALAHRITNAFVTLDGRVNHVRFHAAATIIRLV